VSDRERSSTAETTPISTPRAFSTDFPRRPEKESLVSWHHKQAGFGAIANSYVDSTLSESDFEDSTFPLFNEPSGDIEMANRTAPINFTTTSRHESPRSAQSSNLTSALKTTSGNEVRPPSNMDTASGSVKLGSGFGRATSGSQYDGGAQPISMNASNREKPRRESLAGSMVTGMSWGGNSVGSWIRDEYVDGGFSTRIILTFYSIIMQGTSPFAAYQSPSYHSSSYLPKLEANFMRDFSCCGLTLASLHELLQHYEEQHTGSLPPSLQKQNSSDERYDGKVAVAANTAAAIQGQGRVQERPVQIDTTRQGQVTPRSESTPVTPRQSQQDPQQVSHGYAPAESSAIQEDDTVGDMEMDDYDFAPPSNALQQLQYPVQNQGRIISRSQFGQPASSRVPPLDMNTLNMGNPIHQQHQGLRNSQPTTPVSAGRNGNMFHNNPTVSSVNTPTLATYNTNNAHPLQHQQYYTPDSSAPGTPGEFDEDLLGNMGNMNIDNMGYMNNNQPFGGFGYGDGNDMLDLCIDEPAKRLFALNGGFNNPQQPVPTSATQLGDAQYSENSELAKTIRAEQKRAGVPEPPLDGGIPKPFHCPVIGCEKAYKNQNGLKYHKSVSVSRLFARSISTNPNQHGHNAQKLQTNSNGTYSIVDPDTLIPYKGTLGMEKHKPYRCKTCGKRYKNLNGLKYHKVHTPNCDRESPNPPNDYQPAQTKTGPSQQNPAGPDDMIM